LTRGCCEIAYGHSAAVSAATLKRKSELTTPVDPLIERGTSSLVGVSIPLEAAKTAAVKLVDDSWVFMPGRGVSGAGFGTVEIYERAEKGSQYRFDGKKTL